MKKIISLLMSIVLLFNICAETVTAYDGDHTRIYETENCSITYTIQNEWADYKQISVSITNNGMQTLRNWALKFDASGEITNIWNAEVCYSDGEIIAVRNCGYNYEIIPNETVEFGFQIRGEDFELPKNISFCNKTVDSTNSADITYKTTSSWDGGFIGEISITNNSDEPLEAWRLSFDGNFEIVNLWNAVQLYTENGFLVESNVSTMPIAKGETKTFGFQGTITSGETPTLTNFVLTSIVVDVTAEDSEGKEENSGAVDPTEPTNPENPVNPDNPTDPVGPENPDVFKNYLLCFGSYTKETNSVKIYWISTNEGEISLYESTDNGGWVKIVDAVEGDYYEYKINDSFLIKQIKAVQKTENGRLESEPFVVANTEDGIVCTWLDSDNDGLADFVEEAYGTNPENPDTDNDGLTDYEEIYITGTNPLKYDTDENGINDADDDVDSDGLSNKDEIGLGTSVFSADTDEDGLSDYDELNKRNTNPLKFDSDGDTLNDGEETAIGLNPNDPETFGIPDAEYKVEQTISADSEAMSEINNEESPYEMSLEISATGNAATRLSANESTYSVVTESNARLGGAVELRYLGGDVDKVKLSYKIDDKFIQNDDSEYAENCRDLQGIRRYNIFRYFEEINMLLPVATEFDEKNNTLFAETDELGTYCVLDMEVLMQNLGIEPTYISGENVAQMMCMAAPVAIEEETKSDKYSVTFVVDDRADSIPLQRIKDEIANFETSVKIKNLNVDIRIVSQSKMSLFGEYVVVTDKLSDIIDKADKSENNYIFELYGNENVIFEQNIATELCQKAIEKGIIISVFTPFDDKLEGYQSKLVDSTGGMIGNGFDEFTEKNIYEYIFGEEYVAGEYLHAFTATGYKNIVLDTLLYANGKNPSGIDTDTDNDGLTDWDEVYNELLTFDKSGRCVLPTVRDCIKKLGDIPFYVENYFSSNNIIASYYGGYKVLPIKTDPTNADSDMDELNDVEELQILTNPLNRDTDGDLLSDGEEYYVGTSLFLPDTDGDGLSDYLEVELWFDPLNYNSDGDFYNDYEEWKNGTDPYVYDYTGEQNVLEFFKGFGLGDWDAADNIPQLLGQVAGSFFPLVADARDYFANVLKNLDTLAALANLGGFLLDLVPVLGSVGDAAKAAPKVAKFVTKYADDAPKTVEAITQVSKLISKDDDLIPALVKSLDAKTLDKIADSLQSTKNITKADYSKSLDILEAAGKNTDFGKTILSTLSSVDARRLTKLAEKYGDNVLKAIEKCGSQNIENIIDILSKVNPNQVTDMLDLLASHGDDMLKAVNKISIENIDSVIDLLKKFDAKQVSNFLELLNRHGDDLIKAIKKCGDDYTDLIISCVSNEKFSGDVATYFLNAMSDHSDTMIKAINACGVENYSTIADYAKIFNKFGDQADDLFHNGDRVFREFVGLDTALDSNASAICFASTKAGDKCFVAVSGVYTYNRTITVSEDIAKELRRIDALNGIPPTEKGKMFTQVYNSLLSDEYLKTIPDPNVQREYKKLIDAISNTRSAAKKANAYQVYGLTGIVDEYSFAGGRSVINCAEIWVAREHILAGGKFDELFFSTRYLNQSDKTIGALFPPCKNCQHTFSSILSNLEGS